MTAIDFKFNRFVFVEHEAPPVAHRVCEACANFMPPLPHNLAGRCVRLALFPRPGVTPSSTIVAMPRKGTCERYVENKK